MNCPVCERSLAPTLSICPSCGAMMNDTVREELQPKITVGAVSGRIHLPESKVPRMAATPAAPAPYAHPVPAQRATRPVQTTGLAASKTSPTLVEFQQKNTAVPDWRLQLQNAVQQRRGAKPEENIRQPLAVTPAVAERRQTATALAVEEEVQVSDPRVANAMKRIAESRKTFSEPSTAVKRNALPQTAIPLTTPARPFGVVAAAASPARSAVPTVHHHSESAPKPRLVAPAAASPLKRDTNRLPRIEMASLSSELAIPATAKNTSGPLSSDFLEMKSIQIKAENAMIDEAELYANEVEEIEDLAPFSMRFGAGLFDLIIGTFASLIVLSPFAFTAIEWANGSGLLTFIATTAFILFVYMTVSLGFTGKTVGMKVFSLELVDAIENEYPTLRQAAISSCGFIISLAFAGAGFITIFFNEEKRAAHDLISGTILVREF